MAKLKILQVVRSATGGMKEHVISLLKNVNREEFDLSLACPSTSQVGAMARELGLPVFPVEINGSITPWQDGWDTVRLAGIIKQWGAQVVHAHGAKAGLLARAACLMLRKRPATVITAHNFVYTGSLRGWQQKLFQGAENSLLTLTDRVIAVSQSLREEILASQAITPDKVCTIYNGLDVQDYSTISAKQEAKKKAKQRLGLNPQLPVVGTVGRFAPQKGLAYFIKMVACLEQQLPGMQYLIVGDGPLRGNVESMAKGLGVRENITFTGYLSDIIPALKAMDIFIQPSLSEGLGITVLEALASRLPVIATAVGGLPEIITHGENGLLVPAGSGRLLADQVLSLCSDPQYAQSLASRGFEQVAKKFSLSEMISATEAVYREVWNVN
jgi:glycosyltransferase involved in cell wall biosynthesis